MLQDHKMDVICATGKPSPGTNYRRYDARGMGGPREGGGGGRRYAATWVVNKREGMVGCA